MNAFAQIQADIHALNSSVLVLGQKMQYLVRNEKILGRNLIVLSKRLKELEANGGAGGGSGAGLNAEAQAKIEELMQKVESHGQKLLDLQNELQSIKENSVSKEEFAELKYVIDAINPLEFVTQKQLNEKLGGKEKATAVSRKK